MSNEQIQLMAIIERGEQLTVEQYERALMVLTVEQLASISDDQLPAATVQQSMIVFNFNRFEDLEKWCVYTVNDTFVGHCRLQNVFATPDLKRSTVYKRSIVPDLPVQIKVLEFHTDQSSARRQMQELQQTGKFANLGVMSTASRKFNYLCVTDGEQYHTVQQMSEYYGVSTVSIYTSMKTGKPVKGFSFERLE